MEDWRQDGQAAHQQELEHQRSDIFVCVYCGKEKVSHSGVGTDVSCCGEVGHVEEAVCSTQK